MKENEKNCVALRVFALNLNCEKFIFFLGNVVLKSAIPYAIRKWRRRNDEKRVHSIVQNTP